MDRRRADQLVQAYEISEQIATFVPKDGTIVPLPMREGHVRPLASLPDAGFDPLIESCGDLRVTAKRGTEEKTLEIDGRPGVGLSCTPHFSDRQIARQLGVSHVTVASQREELESIGQIVQCDRQTSDGRIYPATRATKPRTVFLGDRQLGVSDKTIGAVRHELEGSAEIPHFSHRTDPRTGKLSQPATRATRVSGHTDISSQREESGDVENLSTRLDTLGRKQPAIRSTRASGHTRCACHVEGADEETRTQE